MNYILENTAPRNKMKGYTKFRIAFAGIGFVASIIVLSPLIGSTSAMVGLFAVAGIIHMTDPKTMARDRERVARLRYEDQEASLEASRERGRLEARDQHERRKNYKLGDELGSQLKW